MQQVDQFDAHKKSPMSRATSGFDDFINSFACQLRKQPVRQPPEPASWTDKRWLREPSLDSIRDGFIRNCIFRNCIFGLIVKMMSGQVGVWVKLAFGAMR